AARSDRATRTELPASARALRRAGSHCRRPAASRRTPLRDNGGCPRTADRGHPHAGGRGPLSHPSGIGPPGTAPDCRAAAAGASGGQRHRRRGERSRARPRYRPRHRVTRRARLPAALVLRQHAPARAWRNRTHPAVPAGPRPKDDELTQFLLALALFLALHMLPAIPHLRARLVGAMGRRAYLVVY